MKLTLNTLINTLVEDAKDRRKSHRRIPLVTVIDKDGWNCGTLSELHPVDLLDQLIQYYSLKEFSSPVIDMIRDPSDEHSNLLDRNIIIRVNWPANSKTHKWSNDSNYGRYSL